MAYGKAIELFLVDGDANGLVTAELSNWNGKAIKIPRTDVKDCTRHDITEYSRIPYEQKVDALWCSLAPHFGIAPRNAPLLWHQNAPTRTIPAKQEAMPSKARLPVFTPGAGWQRLLK